MVQVSVHINPFLPATPHLPTRRKLTWKISEADSSSSSASSSCGYSYDKQRTDGQLVFPKKKRSRVFFLDVNPLCYAGSKPSLHSFANWISLFFNHVSLSDPVIAVSSHKDHWASWFEFLFSVVCVILWQVVDGERGSEHRRQLLPSYKTHRWKLSRQFSKGHVGRSHGLITDVFTKCNVPVSYPSCLVSQHDSRLISRAHSRIHVLLFYRKLLLVTIEL